MPGSEFTVHFEQNCDISGVIWRLRVVVSSTFQLSAVEALTDTCCCHNNSRRHYLNPISTHFPLDLCSHVTVTTVTTIEENIGDISDQINWFSSPTAVFKKLPMRRMTWSRLPLQNINTCIISRPPVVIFSLCLAVFCIVTFSLGVYVKHSTAPIRNPDELVSTTAGDNGTR